MKKRILSILLTLCMVLTLVPTTAFAEGELGGASEDGATDVSENVLFNKQDTYPYTGEPVDFNPTCDDIKEWSFEYYDSNDAVLDEAPSALGKYTVIIIGFGADCSARIEHTYSIVSVAKEEIQYTAEDYTGVYDKQSHSITLNVSTSDVTIMYSTSADGEYVAEKPTFTDAGTYTVYYLIEKENCDPVSGSATVTITQCTPKLYFTQASVVLQNDQDKCQLEWVYTGDGILRFGSSDDHAFWVDDIGVVYRKRSNCGTSIYCKASETKNCKSVTAMCSVEHGISYIYYDPIYYDPMNNKPIIENLYITPTKMLEEKVEVLTSGLLDLEKPPVLYIDAKLIDPSDPLKKKELHNVRVNFTVPYEDIKEASPAQFEEPLSACDFTVLHQRIDNTIEEVSFLRLANDLLICDTTLSPFAIVAYPKKYYNLYFDVNGGTDTPMIQRVPIDSESYSVTLSSEKPSRSGYKFEGWSTSRTGDVQYMPGDTITLDRDIILYAVWTEKTNTYTVKFNTNGGNTIPDKNVKWSDKVLDGIAAPTRNGREFAGWKCEDTSVTENTTYGDLAVNDTTTSITLVAQWEYITAPTGGSGYRPTRPAAPSEPQPSIGGSEKSWSDVAADLAKLTTGSEATIQLNGNTTVPVEVIKAIAENKLKVTFVVDSIRSWKTDGADITTPAAADLSILATSKLKTDGLRGIYGYQFSMNDANIPTGIEIAFKTEHAGKFANLYKSVDGKLVFVICAKLGEDGKVILPDVVEKGDYVAMLCEFSDRPGDMNNDGVMNEKDASAILKDIVGLEPGKNPLMADFNGDGHMNAMDASAILKGLLG